MVLNSDDLLLVVTRSECVIPQVAMTRVMDEARASADQHKAWLKTELLQHLPLVHDLFSCVLDYVVSVDMSQMPTVMRLHSELNKVHQEDFYYTQWYGRGSYDRSMMRRKLQSMEHASAFLHSLRYSPEPA